MKARRAGVVAFGVSAASRDFHLIGSVAAAAAAGPAHEVLSVGALRPRPEDAGFGIAFIVEDRAVGVARTAAEFVNRAAKIASFTLAKAEKRDGAPDHQKSCDDTRDRVQSLILPTAPALDC